MENEYVSSNLVNRFAITAISILAATAIYFNKSAVAVILIFVVIFSLISRYWGRKALEEVEIRVDGSYSRIFAGSHFQATYHIENNKSIPLLWLELMHDIPAREIARPCESFVRKSIHNQEAERIEDMYAVKFSWILPYSDVQWTADYQALRRGIYQLNHITAFSGDGFGLTISKKSYDLDSQAGFVIYPEVYPVDEAFFRKSLSENASGDKGLYEDRTLLSGIKDYDGRDSFKKINWRLFARGGTLSANIYKTVLPSNCMFLLDTASFLGNAVAFEYMVSMIASVAIALEGRMQIGFCAPATGLNESYSILPSEETSADTILTALSSVEVDASVPISLDTSAFASENVSFGQVFVCTCSKLTPDMKRLATRLHTTAVHFIYADRDCPVSDNSYYAGDLCHFKEDIPVVIPEEEPANV